MIRRIDMRFFSNTINQVNELEKIEKELDRYEPNSEGWLIQCLELQKAQVAVVGGGIDMFLGIYSIYDSMLKEGIYKWSDREFLIDQFEQLLILQSITKDKKIKEISMGMCIAVAGLIEGEFYFCADVVRAFGHLLSEIVQFNRGKSTDFTNAEKSKN